MELYLCNLSISVTFIDTLRTRFFSGSASFSFSVAAAAGGAASAAAALGQLTGVGILAVNTL